MAHIKEKFGIDIPTAIFSSSKSAIGKSKGKKPARRGRKPGRPAGSAAAPVAAKGHDTGNGVALARDVKKLVETYGAASVKEMADVFAG